MSPASPTPATADHSDLLQAMDLKASASLIKVTLDQLVNLCVEKEASDVHFGEGDRVALRVGGKIVFI
ncbi:MAG: hypothetical protein V1760_01175, partial [Candidatus Peregrinibacteria bacterium]